VVGETGKAINWTISGKVPFVDVVYSKNNGSDGFAYTIAPQVNTTNFPTGITWDIPTDKDILAKNTGLIRVKDSDYATVYDDSNNFSIKGVLYNFNITVRAGSIPDRTARRRRFHYYVVAHRDIFRRRKDKIFN